MEIFKTLSFKKDGDQFVWQNVKMQAMELEMKWDFESKMQSFINDSRLSNDTAAAAVCGEFTEAYFTRYEINSISKSGVYISQLPRTT